MSKKELSYERAFISYLDENNIKREGYFDIIRFDSSFVEFETHRNRVVIPTARILKIKYNLEEENGRGTNC